MSVFIIVLHTVSDVIRRSPSSFQILPLFSNSMVPLVMPIKVRYIVLNTCCEPLESNHTRALYLYMMFNVLPSLQVLWLKCLKYLVCIDLISLTMFGAAERWFVTSRDLPTHTALLFPLR